MSIFKAIIRTGFAVAVVSALGVAANAQVKSPNTGINPPAEQQGPAGHDGPRHGRMGRGGARGEMGGLMGFQRLNLSDTQKQQLRDLAMKFHESNRPLSEEMRQIREKFDQAVATTADQQRAQAIRQQMRTAHEQFVAEAQALLTPEQQEQLKTMRQQMQERREQFRQRHGDAANQDTPPQAQ